MHCEERNEQKEETKKGPRLSFGRGSLLKNQSSTGVLGG